MFHHDIWRASGRGSRLVPRPKKDIALNHMVISSDRHPRRLPHHVLRSLAKHWPRISVSSIAWSTKWAESDCSFIGIFGAQMMNPVSLELRTVAIFSRERGHRCSIQRTRKACALRPIPRAAAKAIALTLGIQMSAVGAQSRIKCRRIIVNLVQVMPIRLHRPAQRILSFEDVVHVIQLRNAILSQLHSASCACVPERVAEQGKRHTHESIK